MDGLSLAHLNTDIIVSNIVDFLENCQNMALR